MLCLDHDPDYRYDGVQRGSKLMRHRREEHGFHLLGSFLHPLDSCDVTAYGYDLPPIVDFGSSNLEVHLRVPGFENHISVGRSLFKIGTI